jgi:hypothetical protein
LRNSTEPFREDDHADRSKEPDPVRLGTSPAGPIVDHHLRAGVM